MDAKAGRLDLRNGFLVLVDISGYTRFILAHKALAIPALRKRNERVSQEHAEAIISVLLETVIDGLDDLLIVNKLEGDAALFYALSDEPKALAAPLIDRLLQTFNRFNERLEGLRACDGCFCPACCKRGDLRIKIVAHYDRFMIKQVSRFEELAGDAVILAHRLLKNRVPSHEYLLLTESMAGLVDHSSHWEHRREKVDDFGEIPVTVHYPSEPQVKARRWRPPWPWEVIRMAQFFAIPRSRHHLEERFRAAAVTADSPLIGM